ncbi:MAG TPA: carboxypeptidase-like regulatory domain-containing protein, partial [Vulgatibacter sp.]
MKRLGLVYVLAASAACIACGGSDPGGPAPYRPTGPGYLMGTIRDMHGGTVPGATVEVAGTVNPINEQGWFFIPDVEEGERVSVVISARDFVTTQKVVAVRAGRQTFLDVRL